MAWYFTLLTQWYRVWCLRYVHRLTVPVYSLTRVLLYIGGGRGGGSNLIYALDPGGSNLIYAQVGGRAFQNRKRYYELRVAIKSPEAYQQIWQVQRR